jgi:hypothetical protein
MPNIKAPRVALKGPCLTDPELPSMSFSREGGRGGRPAGAPGGNEVMVLVGCRATCPWAPPVGINPIEESARKEFTCIAFSVRLAHWLAYNTSSIGFLESDQYMPQINREGWY